MRRAALHLAGCVKLNFPLCDTSMSGPDGQRGAVRTLLGLTPVVARKAIT
jgi:hypothetical protein